MTALYLMLAVSDHYPAGTCWAWMDGAERVCGKPEGGEAVHLCGAHVTVARRRLARDVAKVAEQRARRDAAALRRLPKLRDELARVDAEIARRDPAPPTTDLAAFGGEGSTAASRYQKRLLSDSNVTRLAELHTLRDRLAPQVAHAERVAEQQKSNPERITP